MKFDYSLYLVTDRSDALLRGRDLTEIVRASLEGGVTIVQLRDKLSSTKDLIANARTLQAVTRSFGVPLLINDRVDVALAVGADGVHLGQDDMDIATARRLLGPEAIIGITCHSTDEARCAVQGGANYLGIGTLFATNTKPDADQIIGTAGCRSIVECTASEGTGKDVSTVAIGGIKASNVQRVMYQSASPSKSLDGVAVVSAIIASDDPKLAARELRRLLTCPPPFHDQSRETVLIRDWDSLQRSISELTKLVMSTGVLCHNMTNLVVQNFAANVTLAIGGKPIMSNDGNEAQDLASLGGGLVINMGTASAGSMRNYLQALEAYNHQGGPVLLDPVGAGATRQRQHAVKELLAGGYFDVIKGNESEIRVVWGDIGTQQRGVDSSEALPVTDKARLVKKLAARERNIVVMTGETDIVSDGIRTYFVKNGDPYLGMITGTGCTLGATIAAYVATDRNDKLVATIAAMLHFEIAAEMAGARSDVQGPGSFVPAFLDCLRDIASSVLIDNNDWLNRANVEPIML